MARRLLIHLPRLIVGGAQLQLLTWMEVLSERGYELHFLTEGGELVGQAEAMGGHVLPLNSARLSPNLGHVRHLAQAIRQVQPDCLHSLDTHAGVEAQLAACWTGVPLVSTFMSPRVPTFTLHVVGVASIITDFWRQYLVERCHWPESRLHMITARIRLPDATTADASLNARASHRQQLNLPQEGEIALLIAPLNGPKKDSAIHALRGIMAAMHRRESLHLVIISHTPPGEDVQAVLDSAQHDLADRIINRGRQYPTAPYFAASDLVLGRDVVSIEGYGSHRPTLIVSDHGYLGMAQPDDLETLIENNFNGLGLPATTDPETMADDILDHMDHWQDSVDQAREIAQGLRQHPRYDLQQAVDHLETLYTQASEQAGTGSDRQQMTGLVLQIVRLNAAQIGHAVGRRLGVNHP